MTTPTPLTEPQAPRQMLTIEQAAEALNIGRTTTYTLVGSGELESVRIGRLRRVPADAIGAYLDRLQTEQHPDAAR